MVLVPADRLHALLPQRSIRENIAAPLFNRSRDGARSAAATSAAASTGAVERLSIDTRAASQVRRLSGGNQQKVTIARWLAPGLRVMLLFDPTRGIDVGTKHQVYDLIRSLADEGAAIIMFTSELREIALVTDRAAVLHNGRIVAELPADAGESALLPRRPRPRGGGRMSVATSGSFDGVDARRCRSRRHASSRFARRQGWTAGVAVLLVVLLLWRVSQLPEVRRLRDPHDHRRHDGLAFLAMAQGVVVISGGIDLSVGSMMVFANCLSALWMEDQRSRRVPAARPRGARDHRRAVRR